MLEAESARLAALRGTPADFVLITRRYDEMLAAHDKETSAADHARPRSRVSSRDLRSVNTTPVLVHTLGSLTDLMLSSVFASVSNLYHRQPQKRQIDRQHARLYNAITGRLPEQARRAASAHIRSVREGLSEIEQEEQRLVRATLAPARVGVTGAWLRATLGQQALAAPPVGVGFSAKHLLRISQIAQPCRR